MEMDKENIGVIMDRPQDVELSPYGKTVDNAIQKSLLPIPYCRLKAA